MTDQRRWFKMAVAMGFGIYFLRYLFSPQEPLFIYNVDFVFHEAGHLIWGIFGEFMGLVGGTLNQILIPVAAALHFIFKRDYFASGLVAMWLGENFVNISVYAKDARARLLPLHGGENVLHDWSEILYKLNLLHHDQAVGHFFYGLGLLGMVGGLSLALYVSWR